VSGSDARLPYQQLWLFGLRQRQMQVALVGRVDVVTLVREAVRCGDAPRAGRPQSGREIIPNQTELVEPGS
jgi:hypothetical protein